MPDEDMRDPLAAFLTDQQIVDRYPEMFGTVALIRSLRTKGQGWPVFRIGRTAMTDPADLLEWVKARRETADDMGPNLYRTGQRVSNCGRKRKPRKSA